VNPRNIRLLIAYDGTGYSGWQRQNDTATIQGHLEDRLATMTGAPVTLHGAGRTDAGVHALGMVANFNTQAKISAQGFHRGLNSLLPADIRILAVNEVKTTFHSRFDATGKTYRYDILTGRVLMPTERLYALHVPGPLDIDRIHACLRHLLGSHDFSSFEASGSREPGRSNSRGAVRTIYRAEFFPCSGRDDAWSFRFTGDGFLRHMVRNFVGTLIDAGAGKITPEEFLAIRRSRNRCQAGPTAPARALFLEKVFYQEDFPSHLK